MKVAAADITFDFDPRLGILAGFQARGHAPLHTAPWVGEDIVVPAPHLARLGGDFFCAPFAQERDGAPAHGWPPNSPWDATVTGSTLRATLRQRVQGATLSKELTLIDGHPFVYQCHVFDGGDGEVGVANHANVSLPDGGLIATSPKSWWETPGEALEPDPARGRSCLRYPAKGVLTAFPGADGAVDLSRYPWGARHEDFVAGLEARPGPGWTAVVRLQCGDVFLSLRDGGALPMTMLWHSNGGRDYAPWSGRHRGCLGVEEGAARHMLGLSGDGDLTAHGALTLGGRQTIRHVIGVLPWPTEEAVRDVHFDGTSITVTGVEGGAATAPFDQRRL